jgi:predicted glycoside hydrolase/deacetylase ChbG (UPF0249 family)
MKIKITTIILIICMSLFLLSGLLICQASKEIRLIVRGDDMGYSHAANVGCIKAYQEGILTAVEVMVPCPWFPEAVEMLKENPGLDVGIHLTLTSEWKHIKWRPLTHAPSLVDSNGYFYPMVWPDEAFSPDQALGTANWKIEEIQKELKAQIEIALNHIPQCSHLTPHMGFHEISPQVLNLLLRLAKEYNLTANIRLFPLKFLDLFQYGFTADEKISNGVQTLQRIGPGTYEVVAHPGLDTPEMRAIWHVGAENDPLWRASETSALTSDKLKEIIKKRHIKLIGYDDLKFWH